MTPPRSAFRLNQHIRRGEEGCSQIHGLMRDRSFESRLLQRRVVRTPARTSKAGGSGDATTRAQNAAVQVRRARPFGRTPRPRPSLRLVAACRLVRRCAHPRCGRSYPRRREACSLLRCRQLEEFIEGSRGAVADERHLHPGDGVRQFGAAAGQPGISRPAIVTHGIGLEPASVGPAHRLRACGLRVRCLVGSRVYVSVHVSAPRHSAAHTARQDSNRYRHRACWLARRASLTERC